ncbi:Flagellar hook-length control protein FliK [Solibacillus isronensis B3W22]|uniref:Flagellar hook-length control protein FliK n=1 Tax=Solibacillus isronensis B3W22 TaxID=1224748 RepID=K1L8S6_9BACL|nr:flagellar hook-length control protein FliK [Solibacillus isronensis]AMO84693.1 flagellar hook-length control protein [Solibacillus silvestris]EKB46868.1 Flagellar hook-length control protein FliK [Solibacillus isronensis B3W22]
MNIAMLQTVKMPKQDFQPNIVKSEKPDSKAFGSVFNSMITKSSAPTAKQPEMAKPPLAESISGILEEDSLESLLEQLGVEMDETGLFALVGEESTPIALDELMTLDNLTELLGITKAELSQIIEQLLGDAKQEITDIWSLIEQAPNILNEVLAAVQKPEQNNVQPKELQQIVQLLKLAQLAGSKVDTVYQQEIQLASLKDALLALANEAQKSAGTEQSTVKTTTFQQVVQQGQQSSLNQQTTVKVETDTQTAGHIQQQVTQTKTVTVTLPAEKPAQSDALIKEIQNLINRSQLSGQPGNMKLFLKLFPENLGQIRIELVQKDGVMTARLLATTAMGKELLENNINQLKAGFVAQNIQMERIDVAQSLQDADRNARDQNFFNNFFRQKDEEKQENNEDTLDEESLSFKDLLSEEVE